jgi:glycerophosphoryl diester phosphodiesterase
MARRTPLVIGHRGAPGYRPEHSRSSYDLALEFGVDAVEPDIVVSADGVLVVRHENEISGTTDVADRIEFKDRRTTKTVDGAELTGWFAEDFTWDEL